MRKLIFFGLLAACVSLSCALFAAPTLVPDNSKAICTDMVVLNHTTTAYMLNLLGIDSNGRPIEPSAVVTLNKKNPNDPKALAETQAALMMGRQYMIPRGIEGVRAGRMGETLLIRGTRLDIDQLKMIISKLDVAPRTIQVKAEFYKLDSKLAAKIIPNAAQPAPTVADIKAIQKKLADQAVEPVATPIISVLDKIRGNLSIDTVIPYKDKASGKQKELTTQTALSVLANTSNDQINLRMLATIPSIGTDPAKPGQQTISIVRQVTSGEPILIIGDEIQAGKSAVLIVTATIIETAPESPKPADKKP